MKNLRYLFIIVGLSLIITGCSGSLQGPDKEDNLSQENDLKQNDISIEVDSMLDEQLDLVDASIVEDDEGLVSLQLKNGEAFLYLNLDRWDSQLDLGDYEEIYPGPFNVDVKSAGIKDASIGRVDNIDFRYVDFPTVFLLMDNGDIEWFNVILEDLEGLSQISSEGKIKGIPPIESLFNENSGDGFGKIDPFGKGRDGNIYNLTRAVQYTSLTEEAWFWGGYGSWLTIEEGEVDIASLEDYYGVLYFFEDGNLLLKKGYLGQEISSYWGTYDLQLSEKDDRRPGILSISLYIDMDSGYPNQASYIGGDFFTEVLYQSELHLYKAGEEGLFDDVIDYFGPYVFSEISYDIFDD